MSIDALVFWIFVLAWVGVLGLIVLGAVPRIVREGMRIAKRVLTLINDSPLDPQIAKAQSDVVRVEAALERLPELVSRARAAVALIRATPLVPRSIADAVGRARRGIRAFRSAARWS